MFPKEVTPQLQNEDKLPRDTQHSSDPVLCPKVQRALPERRNFRSCWGNVTSIKNHWSLIKRGPNKGLETGMSHVEEVLLGSVCVQKAYYDPTEKTGRQNLLDVRKAVEWSEAIQTCGDRQV